jgi:type IV secretion system protein VirB10
MKLAMRLPEKGQRAVNDGDPRDQETTEVIDLASRTAYPVVAQRKGRSDALGLAAGVGFVALLGAATLWGLNASRMGDAQQVAPVPAAPAPGAFIPPAPAAGEQVPLVNAVPGAPGADPAPFPVLAQPPMTNVMPAGNPYASPTLVYDSVEPVPPVAAALASQAIQANQQSGGGAANDFAARVGGVGGSPASATSDIDPKTTVTQGTMIPAVLETAINTDVPGFVRAVVSQDVRSFDGTRVLVPRSSRRNG